MIEIHRLGVDHVTVNVRAVFVMGRGLQLQMRVRRLVRMHEQPLTQTQDHQQYKGKHGAHRR
jgi:hypothetical protein